MFFYLRRLDPARAAGSGQRAYSLYSSDEWCQRARRSAFVLRFDCNSRLARMRRATPSYRPRVSQFVDPVWQNLPIHFPRWFSSGQRRQRALFSLVGLFGRFPCARKSQLEKPRQRTKRERRWKRSRDRRGGRRGVVCLSRVVSSSHLQQSHQHRNKSTADTPCARGGGNNATTRRSSLWSGWPVTNITFGAAPVVVTQRTYPNARRERDELI